jgi:hypothetical protein
MMPPTPWTRAINFKPHHAHVRHALMMRVGQNLIYTVYKRYYRQGNRQIYSHIRCIYTVLHTKKLVLFTFLFLVWPWCAKTTYSPLSSFLLPLQPYCTYLTYLFPLLTFLFFVWSWCAKIVFMVVLPERFVLVWVWLAEIWDTHNLRRK